MMIIQEWAIRHSIPPAAVNELLATLGLSVQATTGTPVAMSSEAATQQMVRLRVAQRGGIAWRNNSGACQDETGRMIRYGLGNDSQQVNRIMKSSDLIGITPVLIQPGHVGHIIGVFTAYECKAPGWKYRQEDDRAAAQFNFGKKVMALGGIFQFVTNPNEV